MCKNRHLNIYISFNLWNIGVDLLVFLPKTKILVVLPRTNFLQTSYIKSYMPILWIKEKLEKSVSGVFYNNLMKLGNSLKLSLQFYALFSYLIAKYFVYIGIIHLKSRIFV